MLVRVYPDGEVWRARDYQVEPREAAKTWLVEPREAAKTWLVEPREAAKTWLVECADPVPHDLVAEPLDDEARALLDWTFDVDGVFRLFKVVPVVTWSVLDVTPPPDRTGPKLKGSAR